MKRLTPINAIRKFCIDCVGSSQEIKNCKGDKLLSEPYICPLFEFRFGVKPQGVKMPLLKAIRQHCLYCMEFSPKEVNLCPSVTTCCLYQFRFGHNPKRKGIGEIDSVSPKIYEKKGS